MSLSASSSDLGVNGEKRITATFVNNLPIPVTGVAVWLEAPDDVSNADENPVNIGSAAPGQSIPVSWNITVPTEAAGRYDLKVGATADGLAPIYEGIVLIIDGPPSLKMDVDLPASIPLGQNANGNLIARNTGGGNLNVSFDVNPSVGLGGFQQNLPEIQLGAHEIKTLPFSLSGSIVGVHPVSVTARQATPSGEVSTHVTGTTEVTAGNTKIILQMSPGEISQGPAADVSVLVSTEDGTPAEVRISGISSDSEKRYALYDGVSRVLSEPVAIPPGGKSLFLREFKRRRAAKHTDRMLR